MKTVVIFFFSGTGNTEWVSFKVAEQLQGHGIQVTVLSIENIDLREAGNLIHESDLVGFAYPVYGSDLPQIMKDFIERLTPVTHKKAFVFCTQWLWSGDGAKASEPFLRARGFTIEWAEHFLMPNNVCVSAIPLLPYTNDRKKIEAKLNRSKRKVRKFAALIMSGRPFRRGFNLFSKLSGDLQRVPFRRMFHKLRDDIRIDKDNCIKCGLCLKNCPAGNIYLAKDELKTRGTCIMCLRCYNFCPVSAVMYLDKRHNKKRGEPYKGPKGGCRLP